MFRGSFEHTLDSKGRLSVPARFRDVLIGKGDDRIVMTNFVIDGQRCLDVIRSMLGSDSKTRFVKSQSSIRV
jgi:DNA-binding transcriptional regulator/RsmH inhibitor MraZ